MRGKKGNQELACVSMYKSKLIIPSLSLRISVIELNSKALCSIIPYWSVMVAHFPVCI